MTLAALLLTILFARAENSTVDKAKFLEHMKSGLPNMICTDESYFRKCFEITKSECEKQAIKETQTCVDSVGKDIPKLISQPDEGSKWGASVGNCTGLALEKSFKKKRKNTSACNDPSQWMGK